MVDLWLNTELSSAVLESVSSKVHAKLTVLKEFRYEYKPIGETWVFVLSESHCVVHTYPENRYLSVDLYVCNLEFDIEAFIDDVVNMLDVEHVNRKVTDRGVR